MLAFLAWGEFSRGVLEPFAASHREVALGCTSTTDGDAAAPNTVGEYHPSLSFEISWQRATNTTASCALGRGAESDDLAKLLQERSPTQRHLVSHSEVKRVTDARDAREAASRSIYHALRSFRDRRASVCVRGSFCICVPERTCCFLDQWSQQDCPLIFAHRADGVAHEADTCVQQ